MCVWYVVLYKYIYLYMYIYICVVIWIYICIYQCLYIYIYIHMPIYLYIYILLYMMYRPSQYYIFPASAIPGMVELGAWRDGENLAKGRAATKPIQEGWEISAEGNASQWGYPMQNQNRYRTYLCHLWVWKGWPCIHVGLFGSAVQPLGRFRNATAVRSGLWWFRDLLRIPKENHEHTGLLETRAEDLIVLWLDPMYLCLLVLPFSYSLPLCPIATCLLLRLKDFPKGLGKGFDAALIGAWLEHVVGRTEEDMIPVSRFCVKPTAAFI